MSDNHKPPVSQSIVKQFLDIEANNQQPKLSKKDPTTFIYSSKTKALEPIWHEKLEAMDIPDLGYIVDHIVSESGITAISAIPGRNKTNIGLDVAINVAQGTPLFGQFETK